MGFLAAVGGEQGSEVSHRQMLSGMLDWVKWL